MGPRKKLATYLRELNQAEEVLSHENFIPFYDAVSTLSFVVFVCYGLFKWIFLPLSFVVHCLLPLLEILQPSTPS